MKAATYLLVLLAAPLLVVRCHDDVAELAKAVASDLEDSEVDELDEALYEGFVQGVALNFDYVSFGKQSTDDTELTPQEKETEHEHNLHKAEIEADYLTKHRPLESSVVDETESDLYSLFNILMHYLSSRSQPWKLVEPKTEGLEDGMEHHMIFVSEADNSENKHIPRNMVLSVGNIAKTLPQKGGKSPILLTCLETFIVSKLAFNLMSRLVKSPAPIDTKLKYVDRWIHLVQNHFVLYLPYITITAQRCVNMLSDDGQLKSEFSGQHYETLLKNCNVMVGKRDNESDLQTFVMLDAELHSALIERCIHQRHIIPSLLEEKETHLKRIHSVLDREMSWETFSNAVNMVFGDVERNILKADDYLMKPSTWGCGLSKSEANEAEKKLIGAFIKSHVELNLKVRSTIVKLNRVIADAAPDKGATLAEALLAFVEHEHHAAAEEAQRNNELSQCIDDAVGFSVAFFNRAQKRKFSDEASHYGENVTKESYTSGIAVDMKKYQNEGWMPCMSARILNTIVETCGNKVQYCKVLLEVLRDFIDELEPDSTSALVMENLHNVVSVSLLKNKAITAEDLRSYLAKVAKNELKEVNSMNGASDQAKPSEAESKETKKEEAATGGSDHDKEATNAESTQHEVQSESTEQAIKEH
ncbi:Atypical ABC1 ABC1-C kinase, putative [Babesia ovata]|uniref:Atypical ABC1 ABC1-C kinase, putative n=1 Tax=Babesia ovata TaxID=189622 RepID=A0A2H6K9A5_9APIC|nr:Atypical ABC1 ABC1-C kinase, putative [Babesia ovata]GBE59539.1 Atypical ABC1 ABC1-C kinase, putative [Babesia ovata]